MPVKLLLSDDQLDALLSHVPHWDAVVFGPQIPFSGGERAVLRVENILHSSREDAESAVLRHIMDACAEENAMYFEDEWTIENLQIVNGN